MTSEEIKLVLEVVNTALVLVSTLAIVITTIIAIYAWKKEFKGKRKIELAEEVLALFYEARDAIRAIRNPFGFQGEGATRKPQENEAQEEKEARDRAYVVYERFDKRKEVFNKLHSKRYQFMARFGTKKAKPFEDIRMIVIEIQVSADSLAEIWSISGKSEATQKREQEDQQEDQSVIWSGGKDNIIDHRLKKVISDIEAICQPIIMGK